MELLLVSNNSGHGEWIVDSGAGCHMTNSLDDVKNLVSTHSKVKTASGEELEVIGEGTIQKQIGDKTMLLKKVLVVPDIKRKIVSVAALCADGYQVKFNEVCVIEFQNEIICKITATNGLFVLSQTNEVNHVLGKLEHERMGHASKNIMRKHGVRPPSESCSSCIYGEHRAKKVSRKGSNRVFSQHLLELVHMDLIGPLEIESFGGAKYVLSIIDDFSRFSFVYFLKQKSETFENFKKFRKLAENQLGRKIRAIKSDSGGEFISNEFKTFLNDKGVIIKRSAPYNKAQNGIIERLNRTLMVKARSMLFSGAHDKKWWGEAVASANFIRNHLYCKPIKCSPSEIWFGYQKYEVARVLKKLRVWGCLCYVRTPKTLRKKLDKQSTPMMLIGYAFNEGGY